MSGKRLCGWGSGRHCGLRRLYNRSIEERLNRRGQSSKMVFQRWSQRINPVRRAKEIFEIVVKMNVLDPKLNDVQVRVCRELDFAQDLLGIIRVYREDKHHYLAVLNSARDLSRKRPPRLNIPRSDPTANTGFL